MGVLVVGDFVGDKVGLEVNGLVVGLEVVGESLGLFVGDTVGIEVVGDAVGKEVPGDAVGILVSPVPSWQTQTTLFSLAQLANLFRFQFASFPIFPLSQGESELQGTKFLEHFHCEPAPYHHS